MSPEKEIIREAASDPGRLQLLWTLLLAGVTSLWAILTKRVFDIPRDYVLKDDIRLFINEVKEEDRRLYEKIETAVEKLHGKVDLVKEEVIKLKGR